MQLNESLNHTCGALYEHSYVIDVTKCMTTKFR